MMVDAADSDPVGSGGSPRSMPPQRGAAPLPAPVPEDPSSGRPDDRLRSEISEMKLSARLARDTTSATRLATRQILLAVVNHSSHLSLEATKLSRYTSCYRLAT